MPWNENKNGEKVYILSLYAKEELPTWGELHELYSRGKYFYDPEDQDDQSLDIYWKIPRQKYLLAMLCNQLNKMIFEDHFDYHKCLCGEKKRSRVIDLRFMLTDPPEDGLDKWIIDQLFETSYPPPIITVPMPDGSKNPFIVNNHPRININDLGYIKLIPVLMLGDEAGNKSINVLNNENEDTSECRNYIIDGFFEEYKKYFEEPVGWKDKDPKPTYTIGVDIATHCK